LFTAFLSLLYSHFSRGVVPARKGLHKKTAMYGLGQLITAIGPNAHRPRVNRPAADAMAALFRARAVRRPRVVDAAAS
jgi:hypothetical protein